MDRVVTVNEMRECDRVTILNGTPSLKLMLRAAQGIFDAHICSGKIAIICGNGNNGGDGYALANIMLEHGITPVVYRCAGSLSADAEYYYLKLVSSGINPVMIDDATIYNSYNYIYDCIFGTGLAREVIGKWADIIDKINESNSFVISADIPSGLNGDNGFVQGKAVMADLTVSLGAIKTGHLLNDGMDYTGTLVNCDIGVEIDNYYNLVDKVSAKEAFPKLKRNINKGSMGKLVIIGGCTNYMGAVLLANSGASAVRVGTGINVLAIPQSYVTPMMSRIETSTLYALADNDGSIIYDSECLNRAISGATAIAVGMGLGKGEDNIRIIEHIIMKGIPTVIDADAINCLEINPSILKYSKGNIIITPHPKEFSRLTKISVAEILANPIEIAVEFARENNVIVLLKGVSTIITDGIEVYISNSGSPNMAKGGSGDVLSGIIGGLMSRGIAPILAAYAGAFVAGLSGELAGLEYGEYSACPKDTVSFISSAVKLIANS